MSTVETSLAHFELRIVNAKRKVAEEKASLLFLLRNQCVLWNIQLRSSSVGLCAQLRFTTFVHRGHRKAVLNRSRFKHSGLGEKSV